MTNGRTSVPSKQRNSGSAGSENLQDSVGSAAGAEQPHVLVQATACLAEQQPQ